MRKYSKQILFALLEQFFAAVVKWGDVGSSVCLAETRGGLERLSDVVRSQREIAGELLCFQL